MLRVTCFKRKRKSMDTKSIWKCNHEGKILKNTDHNHFPNSSEIQVKKTLNKLKDITSNNSDMSTQSVIGSALNRIPIESSGQLPNINILKRTIQRVCKQKLQLPNNPTDLNFIILDEMTKTIDGNLFLQYDSGINTERILIFSTTRLLYLMTQCDNWFCDGTFSSAPSLFYQLYTIHAVQYSNVLPSVYILLPNKKENTFKRMFQALKTIDPDLSPKTIMVDFEKGAMNAITSEFPEAKLKTAGLQKKYIDDVTFALQIRKLPSLAYVPENKVIESYEKLLDTKYFIENDELLSPILNYFDDTWIGRTDRRKKRRSPTFKISIWNCYSLVSEDLPRTNNAVEGWHNCFTSILNQCHPSIWKFILALKKEENTNKIKIEQYIAGECPPAKKKYQDKGQRLKQICYDFENRSTDDYLQEIAHNFQLQL
ncbi:hypothetical protein AGLY_007403 [Aphis glycines]|uniref:MULE transposase domain-containing protein n=1 Tax=Aphis glycines TaxID=307491 RepID=A0A6G0TNQ0_APHGL|nr:hypothetical protein AGLY_007403 [Aphis glycines]